MTEIQRGSSFDDASRAGHLYRGVPSEEGTDEGSSPREVGSKHHFLLVSHFISTAIHLISSAILYLFWYFAGDRSECGEKSIFLTNLQAILIGIYGSTVLAKVALLVKHFCHQHVPAKYVTIITKIIAAKQFLLAVICEVFLEALTTVSISGCLAIRNTVPVWSARLFYIFSIVISSIFFALSHKLHKATVEESS